MYFIPRNNKIYHYIAHTNAKKRYLFTAVFVISLVFICMYFMQRLINVYTVLYAQELADLQKKYKEINRLERKNKQLIVVIDDTKKEIQKYIPTTQSEYIKKQLLFVLDIIKNSGLHLHSYGIQKDKNKTWYKKEIAHFDLTGSFKQIIEFLELLKKSEKMISISQWTLARENNDIFHLHCDLEFIVISVA